MKGSDHPEGKTSLGCGALGHEAGAFSTSRGQLCGCGLHCIAAIRGHAGSGLLQTAGE
jgi:hypothetical protein